MTVHIGRVTSEVHSTSPGGSTTEPDAGAEGDSEWEEQVRLAALLERTVRDQRRTATGCDDD